MFTKMNGKEMLIEISFLGSCLGLVAILSLVLKKSTAVKRKKPPGPSGIPFFGTIFELDLKNLHLDFLRWQDLYGDIVMTKMNGKNILVLNNTETLKKAFASDEFAPRMSDRPLNFLGEVFYDNYKDVLLRRYDSDLIRMREVMMSAMGKHGFKSDHFRNLMSEELQSVTSALKETKGNAVDPLQILMPSFCNVIGMLFTGKRYEREDPLLQHLIDFEHYGDTIIQPQVHSVYKMFPWIRYFPCYHGRLYRKVENLKDQLFQQLIVDMRKSYKSESVQCFIHELMKVQADSTDESGNSWLTDQHILGFIMDLINTSVLTTKAIMSGFIFLLIHFPEMQEKIRAEIMQVIGPEREPDYDKDIDNMPYTRACIFEALRYQSHLPLTAPHANLTEDVEFEGHFIPKETVIFGNLFACHHDPNTWEEPWSFKPERYLDDEGKFVPPEHNSRKNFVAFGVGNRYCVGKQMAFYRMFMYITYFLQRLKFTTPEGMILQSHDPRNMKSESPVILPPDYQCNIIETGS